MGVGLIPKGKVTRVEGYTVCLGGYFSLARFHPNRRDGMYHARLVLSWNQS